MSVCDGQFLYQKASPTQSLVASMLCALGVYDHTSIMNDMKIYFQIISMSKRRFEKKINSEVQWDFKRRVGVVLCWNCLMQCDRIFREA